jgi:hypothetical protein
MRPMAMAAALGLAVCVAFAAPAAEDKVTEEVIVKGTRPEVEKRVNTFVTGITHRGYALESLVRWNTKICPLVAGIPAGQGEFILHGISQVARDAGVELDGENCKPNFHVVLTPEPDQLLDLWSKRAPKLYGMAPLAKVRHILGKFISSVIVVVDLDDTQQIKLGPLTDYISMVGLTDVDLDGDWGHETTILRLFAASGDAIPKGLSIWDRAFLKALYATSQDDRHQRTEIARAMVNDLMAR